MTTDTKTCAICGDASVLNDDGTPCPNPAHRWAPATEIRPLSGGDSRIIRAFPYADHALGTVNRSTWIEFVVPATYTGDIWDRTPGFPDSLVADCRAAARRAAR